MNRHDCHPLCAVCALDVAREREAARAELLPRLAPFFYQPEEGTREPVAA